MPQNKFTKMRLMLHAANELLDNDKISLEEYETLVNGIENDYNRLVSELETQELGQLLLNYLNKNP